MDPSCFVESVYYGRPFQLQKDYFNRIYGLRQECKVPSISKVIFNDPATIVIWADRSKTVVKCQAGDIFDPEKGLAMAIAKKALGGKGNYCNVFHKWLPKTEQKKTRTIMGKVCDVKSDYNGVYITADLTKAGSDYLNKMLDMPIMMSVDLAEDNE